MMYRFERVSRMTDPSFALSLDRMTSGTLSDFERFLFEETKYVELYPDIYKDIAGKDLPKREDRIPYLTVWLFCARLLFGLLIMI